MEILQSRGEGVSEDRRSPVSPPTPVTPLSFIRKEQLLHFSPPPRGAKTQNFPDSNFPDKVRETVSHDKPKKRAFASHDIAKEYLINVLIAPPPPTLPP